MPERRLNYTHFLGTKIRSGVASRKTLAVTGHLCEQTTTQVRAALPHEPDGRDAGGPALPGGVAAARAAALTDGADADT